MSESNYEISPFNVRVPVAVESENEESEEEEEEDIAVEDEVHVCGVHQPWER